MQDNKDLQEFDLDEILSEFQDVSGDGGDSVGLTDDIEQLMAQWDSAESPAATAAETEAPPADTADQNASAAPMDTIRMNQLIAEIMEQSGESRDSAEGATIAMDQAALHKAAQPDQTVTDAATIRMDAAADKPTIHMKSLKEQKPESASKIVYNPRTRLRELKKKLIAGPEKRYYELSEMGVGRMQISILLNLVIVVLSILTTTLFSMDMIPDNRLRFVIFTQVLALLLSAFLGCAQILDGIGDLFRARFSIYTMLVFTFAACCADAVFCLSELRIPCCAAFSMEIAMAQWAKYQHHSTEMAQMDTMRKAVRLCALVKEPDYYQGKPGILRREGEVEDFMDHYTKASGPQILQNVYCLIALLLCIGIALFAGMTHSVSMGIQILSTSLLVAVPASFFVSLTRPAALLERRLHMVGSVLCGWQGVRRLCGKAAFPLQDEDLFPANTTKLNGVKFYGHRDPDEVLSFSASLICAAGGGLVTAFRNMLESREGTLHTVKELRDYGSGGIGGIVCGEPVLLGSLDFLQDMGVTIPKGTMVNQAVYAAINEELCAVYAISYAKMRSSAAGIVSLCANRKITPVLTGVDFMLTDSLLRAKFSVNTRRIAFPDQGVRSDLRIFSDDPELPALALATRDDLAAYAYAVSGARALRSSCCLGVAVHLVGGILGLMIMAALAYLGTTDLLTPTHILLYQLVWLVPALLITEWTRTV